MKSFYSRIASAPISWGICEVPGWGKMLPTDRVLSEMNNLGLPATELGAPGFLPSDANEISEKLGEFEMSLIGGFTPVVVHDKNQNQETLSQVKKVAELFKKTGATHLVSSPVYSWGWDAPKPLSADEYKNMFSMFSQIDKICEDHGLTNVLHPHLQTTVESKDEIERVLDGCDVKWCLDTGHMAIGGVDITQTRAVLAVQGPQAHQALEDARQIVHPDCWKLQTTGCIQPGGVRHGGHLDGALGAVEKAVEHLRVHAARSRVFGCEAVMVPHRVGRALVVRRQVLGALARRHHREPRGPRPVHHFTDQRGLVAIRQRIHDARLVGPALEQRAGQCVRLHVHHHDVLLVFTARQHMRNARRRITGGVDHDVHERRLDERHAVECQHGRDGHRRQPLAAHDGRAVHHPPAIGGIGDRPVQRRTKQVILARIGPSRRHRRIGSKKPRMLHHPQNQCLQYAVRHDSLKSATYALQYRSSLLVHGQ